MVREQNIHVSDIYISTKNILCKICPNLFCHDNDIFYELNMPGDGVHIFVFLFL